TPNNRVRMVMDLPLLPYRTHRSAYWIYIPAPCPRTPPNPFSAHPRLSCFPAFCAQSFTPHMGNLRRIFLPASAPQIEPQQNDSPVHLALDPHLGNLPKIISVAADAHASNPSAWLWAISEIDPSAR